MIAYAMATALAVDPLWLMGLDIDTGKASASKAEKVAIWIFRIALLAMVIFGSVREANVIWTLGDVGVGLTAWINVIALLLLCPEAVNLLRDYEQSL